MDGTPTFSPRQTCREDGALFLKHRYQGAEASLLNAAPSRGTREQPMLAGPTLQPLHPALPRLCGLGTWCLHLVILKIIPSMNLKSQQFGRWLCHRWGVDEIKARRVTGVVFSRGTPYLFLEKNRAWYPQGTADFQGDLRRRNDKPMWPPWHSQDSVLGPHRHRDGLHLTHVGGNWKPECTLAKLGLWTLFTTRPRFFLCTGHAVVINTHS